MKRRNISKTLRTAYYAALSGITYAGEAVPVVDGFLAAEDFSSHHIIISSISEVDDSPQAVYDDEVVVNLDIVTIFHNAYSRDICDDIEDAVLQRLTGATITLSGASISGLRKLGSDYLEEIGENGNIVRKIIRMNQRITQQ